MKARLSSVCAAASILAATLAALFSAITLTDAQGGLTLTKSSNNLVLSFPTTTTNYYGLQTSPDLVQQWTNIQAGLQGYGLVKTVTLSNALLASGGFYRMVTQPTPVRLLLPQSTAFAIIGYDCGGIQEQVYATGFDPATGHATGNVYLRTVCSCGKDCSSTHTASATATWDFAGNVVSASSPATGGPTNSTFIATDRINDILYNAGANAYLMVPVPEAPASVTAVQSGDQFQVAWISQGVNPAAITSSTLTATPIDSTNSVLTATAYGPTTNGIIASLQPSTTYQITVVSTTVGGSGPPSTPIDATTEVASVVPSAPTNVMASWSYTDGPITNNTLTATWSAPAPGNSPIDQYQITITSNGDTSVTPSPATQRVSGTTLTAYFTADSNPGWKVTVEAHNAAGWGPSSTPITLGGL